MVSSHTNSGHLRRQRGEFAAVPRGREAAGSAIRLVCVPLRAPVLELDALNPVTLRAGGEEAIRGRLDVAAWQRAGQTKKPNASRC